MSNLWKELKPGPQPPEIIYVLVEIPKGSRNKYEYDEARGLIKLDRVLYSSLHYPGDYGFIPRTFCEDGDPLDVLVMTNQPTFPGCVIEARPVGLFRMEDRGLLDNKILAVPHTDPLFNEYHGLANVPSHFLAEVAHFFSVYKDLEGMRVKVLGWESLSAALKVIQEAMDLYTEKFGSGEE